MGTLLSIKGRGITTLAINAAGVAGLLAVGYDAHSHAKTNGDMQERLHKGHNLTKSYMNNFKLDSASTVKNEVKKKLFAYEADENMTGFFTTLKGYVSGFASMLGEDVIPLGLSLGAALSKGFVSKAFGVGLLAYGGVFLAQEFFGFGKGGH